MNPVRYPVMINSLHLGWFERNELGQSFVVECGSRRQSACERNMLHLICAVLTSEVDEDGVRPSDEELFDKLCKLAVPVYVLLHMYSYPDEMLAKMLRILPSMVSRRREQIARQRGDGRIGPRFMNGGDA